MVSSSELKKELLEIQSLADGKFQESFYQRLLITTITLLTITTILIIAVSFLLKFVFGGDTLLGDFLLNLGIDFLASTIIFVLFSVVLKSSEQNKKNFKKIVYGFLGVGLLAIILALINNRGRLSFSIAYPQKSDYYIQSAIPDLKNSPLLNDISEACDTAVTDLINNSFNQNNIINGLDENGFINRRYELYKGQEFVNALLLNISAQSFGALIIFVGIEQLFQLFEKQQEVQKSMAKRIEQLAMKIK